MNPCENIAIPCGPPCVPEPEQDPAQKSLVELMDNLNTFIGSSTKLVHSIKEQMEINSVMSAKAAAEAEAARQAELEEAERRRKQQEEDAFRKAVEAEVQRKASQAVNAASQVVEEACCCPNIDASTVTNKQAEQKDAEADTTNLTTSTIQKPFEMSLKFSPDTPNTSQSALKATDADDSPERDGKSCGPKPEKCKKMLRMRKLMMEKIRKERAERTKQIKESISIAQKNLSDIMEQVRQLDRLYEDYELINTPDGEVNPAALYREIMKPTPVPCPDACRPPTAQKIPKGGCPGPAKNPPPNAPKSVICVSNCPTLVKTNKTCSGRRMSEFLTTLPCNDYY